MIMVNSDYETAFNKKNGLIGIFNTCSYRFNHQFCCVIRTLLLVIKVIAHSNFNCYKFIIMINMHLI